MLDRLPNDVLYRILLHVPSLLEIPSAMFSSRKMKETFDDYQDSIMTAVGHNMMGENWPQHARLAYYKSHGVLLPDETAAAKLPFHELGTSKNSILPALVVKDATDIFAQRHAGGKLTEAQAFVVRRALLRLWLYQALFGKLWNRAFFRRRDWGMRTLVRERQQFLDAFPARERAEIDVVHHFLQKSICYWAVDNGMSTETGRSIAREMISSELRKIFDTMLDCKALDLFKEGYNNKFIEERGFLRGAIPVNIRDDIHVDALILNGDRLSEIACHHCNEKGKEIWSPATYAWTGGLWGTPTEMATKFLKPYLSPDEQDDFVIFVKLLENDKCTLSSIIYTVLRLEDESLGNHKTLRWLCVGCLTEVMHKHLHQWMKKERENLARVAASTTIDDAEDGSDWSIDTDDSETEDDGSDSGDDGDASVEDESGGSLEDSSDG